MKRFGKIAVCLASGLAFDAALRATDLPPTANPAADTPYAPIVDRNIFGIVPPPPPPDPNAITEASLPKITVNGIDAFFGSPKAVFKVSGGAAKPGQPPPKDKFYRLREGEGQDDIEVVKIDVQNSLVTFNNHGVVQPLPLTAATDTGGPAPAGGGNPASGGPAPGGKANVGGAPGPNGVIHFSGRGAGPATGGFAGNPGGTGAGANGANPGMNMNFSGNFENRVYHPEASTLTPEETMLQTEANRAKLLDMPPNQRPYPPSLLPPTQLTGKY